MAVCRDAAVAKYILWLKERGVVLNGVALAVFPDTGRGVVALRDLSPGEVLVSVPDGVALTADNGCACVLSAPAATRPSSLY